MNYIIRNTPRGDVDVGSDMIAAWDAWEAYRHGITVTRREELCRVEDDGRVVELAHFGRYRGSGKGFTWQDMESRHKAKKEKAA